MKQLLKAWTADADGGSGQGKTMSLRVLFAAAIVFAAIPAAFADDNEDQWLLRAAASLTLGLESPFWARATMTRRSPPSMTSYGSTRKTTKPYLGRAHAYYANLGKYDQAIADFTEAIRLRPTDRLFPIVVAEVHHDRGKVYVRQGKYDQAIADFTEAIRIDPKDAEAYENRGHAYEKLGDTARAQADLAMAKKLKP